MFEKFPKIPRLSRECVITEKIDGLPSSNFSQDDGGAPIDDLEKAVSTRRLATDLFDPEADTEELFTGFATLTGVTGSTSEVASQLVTISVRRWRKGRSRPTSPNPLRQSTRHSS